MCIGRLTTSRRPLFNDFSYYGDPTSYGFDPLGAYGGCLTGSYGETPERTLCADAEKFVFWYVSWRVLGLLLLSVEGMADSS